MKIYEYMVVYGTNVGGGRIMVNRTKKISSYDELPELDKFILDNAEDKNIKQIVVTDFKLMRVYDNDNDKEES